MSREKINPVDVALTLPLGGCKSDIVDDERIEDISVTYRSHHDPWLRTYGTTGMRVARNAPDSTVFWRIIGG